MRICNFLIVCGLFLLPTLLVSQNATCGFQYRKPLTIQGSRVVGGAHTNMPILISHTDPNLKTTANGENYEELAVLDGAGNSNETRNYCYADDPALDRYN